MYYSNLRSLPGLLAFILQSIPESPVAVELISKHALYVRVELTWLPTSKSKETNKSGTKTYLANRLCHRPEIHYPYFHLHNSPLLCLL